MQEEKISTLLQNIKDNDLKSFKENLKVENVKEILKNEVDNFTYEIIKADSEGKQGREFFKALKEAGITWEIVKDVEDIIDWKYIEGKNDEKNDYKYFLKIDRDKFKENFTNENIQNVRDAIRADDYKTLKNIANKEIEYDEIDNSSSHPLFHAIKNNAYITFSMCIEEGMDAGITENGKTVLEAIIDTNRLDLLIPFITYKGINYLTKNDDNLSALMYAAQDDSHEELVQYLLRKDDDREAADANILNEHGKNALFYSGNAPKNTKILLENGLKEDINHINNHGKTALFYAVKQDNPELIKLFIENGANVNISTVGFRNDNNETEIVIFNPQDRQELIDKKANINLGSGGQTPLFTAIEIDSIEAFKILIQSGANINHCDINGVSPLMHACMNVSHSSNAGEMITMLLDKGADVNQLSLIHENWNALTYVLNQVNDSFSKENIKDIVKSLISDGAEVNDVNVAKMSELGIDIAGEAAAAGSGYCSIS